MRKTVDLDEDVNQMLREEMKLTGKTLSAVFNDAIRRGLEYQARMKKEDSINANYTDSSENVRVIVDKL